MIELDRAMFDSMARFTGFYGEKKHRPQLEAVDAFFDGKRFVLPVFGRRTGKTIFAAQCVCYAAAQPNKTIWIVSKTYDHCGRLWKFLEPMMRKCYGNRFRVRYKSGAARVFFDWGTVIEMHSADHPDSLVGDGIDFIVFDEAALIKDQHVWHQMLSPALADKRGQALFTSTPRGHNWFYDLFESQNGDITVWGKQYPSNMNPYLPPGEYERMRRTMDELVFRQEVQAEFVAFSGMVYSMFDRDIHVLKRGQVRDQIAGWERWVAVDPGLSNPTAILDIAHNTITEEDIVVRDHVASDMLFDDVLALINKWRPSEGWAGAVCDVAGRQRSQETGRSFVGWMRDSGGLQFKHGTKSIMDGINCVRGRLRNMEGKTSLWMGEDAEHTVKMMLNYHFDDNKEEPVKDNVHDHPADALRYFLTYHYNRRKAYGRAA